MTLTSIYLLKVLLLPPNILFLFIILGLSWHRHTRGLWLSATGITLLCLLSLPVVAKYTAGYWEQFPALQKHQIINFAPQAIVVIGGGLSSHAEEFQQEFTVNERTLIRLRYAALLVRETGLPLLVSGGKLPIAPDVTEAQVMAEVLQREFSIPITWIEQTSQNTRENAQNSFQLLKAQGIRKIMLVTQAFHMPRAFSEFSKAGFVVLAAPTDFIYSNSNTIMPFIFSWIPSTRALHNNFLIAHEILGMMWYRLTDNKG